MKEQFEVGDELEVIDSIGHEGNLGDIVVVTNPNVTPNSIACGILVEYKNTTTGVKSRGYEKRFKLHKAKSKKILYPIGTEVQIRDWVIEKEPTDHFTNEKTTVVEYVKEDDFPYRLHGHNDLGFKVEEIKSYRAPESSLKREIANDTPARTGITQDQVSEMIAKAIAGVDAEVNLALDGMRESFSDYMYAKFAAQSTYIMQKFNELEENN